MSIDKTLRFTQSRGFFIIKSLYQNLYSVLIISQQKIQEIITFTALLRGGRLWLPLLTVQAVRL